MADPTTTSAPSINWLPGRKVLAGGAAGLLAYVILTAIHVWGHLDLQAYADILAPPPGTVNITAILTGAITAGVGYIVPPSKKDVINHLNNEIIAMAQEDPASPVTAPMPTVVVMPR